MESSSKPVASRTTGLLAVVAVVAVSALLVWFGTGLTSLWFLTWLAPVPLLWLAPQVGARTAFLAAFLGWGIGTVNLWHYATAAAMLPVVLVVATIAVCALIAAAVVLLFRALVRRGHPILAVVASAGAAVAFDWLLSLLAGNGVFLSISVTQADQMWLVPATAVGGRWIITAAIWSVAAAVAILISGAPRIRTARLRAAAALAAAAVAVAALSATGAALAGGGLSQESRMVAAIAAPVAGWNPLYGFAPPEYGTAEYDDLMVAVERAVADAASDGATDIVVSESTAMVPRAQVATFAERLQQAAPQANLVVGVAILEPDTNPDTGEGSIRNTALVLRPDQEAAQYVKQHLAPGEAGAGTIPGDASMALDDGGFLLGVAICKDLDFPDTMRDYGRAGADLLFVPAWDADLDGTYHADIARLTAAENGTPMIRAGRQGDVTVSDATGTLLASAPASHASAVTATTTVAGRGAVTPYAVVGDVVAYLGAAVALLGLVIALRRRRPLDSGAAPADPATARERELQPTA